MKFSLTFSIVILSFFSIFSKAADRVSEPRPNIVYLLLDDLDSVTSEAYLGQVLKFTMARVAKGTRFEDSYSGVICCESRASILTGLHAHNTRVFTNGGTWGGYEAFRNPKDANGERIKGFMNQPIDNELRALPYILSKKAGYRTVIIGKYMNGFDEKNGAAPAVPNGWTDGYAAVGNTIYLGHNYTLLEWGDGKDAKLVKYGSEPEKYSTDVLTNHALNFLKERAEKEDSAPFFMYLTPTAPHLPLRPAKRHEGLWTTKLPTNRDNYFDDKGWEDKPAWLRLSHDERSAPQMKLWTQVDWDNRMGSLYAVDEMVERIWKKLAETHDLANTIFIVSSDNGYNLGAHSLIHKMAPYQESVRVPLYVFGGSKIKLSDRNISGLIASHIDHAPTILDLAGVPVDAQMDGTSLVPLLRGERPKNWRTELLQQYIGGKAANGIGAELPPLAEYLKQFVTARPFNLDVPSHRSLHGVYQGTTFVFIQWPKPLKSDEFEEELYNLKQDPSQLHNLLHRGPKACQAVADSMRAAIVKQVDCSGASCRENKIVWPKAQALVCR